MPYAFGSNPEGDFFVLFRNKEFLCLKVRAENPFSLMDRLACRPNPLNFSMPGMTPEVETVILLAAMAIAFGEFIIFIAPDTFL